MNECNLNNYLVRCRNKHCVRVRVRGEREGGGKRGGRRYICKERREVGGGGGGA